MGISGVIVAETTLVSRCLIAATTWPLKSFMASHFIAYIIVQMVVVKWQHHLAIDNVFTLTQRYALCYPFHLVNRGSFLSLDLLVRFILSRIPADAPLARGDSGHGFHFLIL